ncbi:MAG TPA: TIGR03620 family F420-dependent LLM class oxidoreductase [Candidatus Saccharimonadales bacterium]|nr:TIGR03620 family F420-dependent LLM class oxidoreductase [Candidatus Saccharimonadales bacterium]
MSVARLGNVRPGRLGIFSGSLAAQPASVQRIVAQEIESLGFGTLWYGEAVAREVFAQGAIFLAATTSLVVASGIANIWARDPMAMAAGGRALAEAWPGRFVLGLGVSHAPMVGARGHQYARPVSAMRDYLEKMSSAPWRGPDAALPPVVLAALGPRMVALAAEQTAGAYPYFTTAEHIEQVRGQLGEDPFLAADLPVVLARNREEARAIGDPHTRTYLGTENYRNNLIRLGWDAAELDPPGSEKLFDAIVAWGDLARVRERVERLFNAGADQVVLNLITRDRSVPYVPELKTLAALNSGFA